MIFVSLCYRKNLSPTLFILGGIGHQKIKFRIRSISVREEIKPKMYHFGLKNLSDLLPKLIIREI